MNEKLSSGDRLELRFLQLGRIEYSDGWNWLRMVVGVLLTAVVIFGLIPMLMLQESEGLNALFLASDMLIALVLAVSIVSWINRSDKRATQAWITELQAQAATGN